MFGKSLKDEAIETEPVWTGYQLAYLPRPTTAVAVCGPASNKAARCCSCGVHRLCLTVSVMPRTKEHAVFETAVVCETFAAVAPVNWS